MNATRHNIRGQVLASATALLVSLAVLTLAAIGFVKVDSQLGLFASKAGQGSITVEVLSN